MSDKEDFPTPAQLREGRDKLAAFDPQDKTLSDVAHEVAKHVEIPPPAEAEAPANFPKIRRNLWDVYHDDERNEVWVGVKCRFTANGRTREGGPIEDVEMSHDQIALITSLDAAKQEALIALARDGQQLQEKRARRAALKGSGILDRLTAGLGRAVNAGKSLIH